MKDTADELLQELESLGEDERSPASASDATPAPNPSASPLETLLEATRLAQEAGEEAQIAAERCLTLAKEEKENLIEMSEALGAWRHASRSAIEDMKAARRHMAIMMGVSLVFGAAAMGVTGWMMYQVKYEAESAKADILDLMQTQFTLFNQKTGLKVDELASLIESMQAEVQRMMKESTRGIHDHVTPVAIVAPGTAEAEAATPGHHASSPAAGESHSTATHPLSTQPPAAPHAMHAPAHAAQQPHAQEHAAHEQPTAAEAIKRGSSDQHLDTRAILTRLDALEKQLVTLLKQQQRTHVPSGNHAADSNSHALAELRKLLLAQEKQLRIIRSALWKLRQQQSKASTLPSPSAGTDLSEIKRAIDMLAKQVQQLREQQQALRETVDKLKKETAKLNQPYRYRAPPLNLE